MRDRQRGTVHLGVVEGNGEPTGLVLTSTSKKSFFFVFAFVLFLCLLGPLGLFLFPLHSSFFFFSFSYLAFLIPPGLMSPSCVSFSLLSPVF